MGLLKFLVWTACAVGLGIFLAGVDIQGRTPMEHAQRAWKQHVNPSAVSRARGGLREALDDADEAVEEARATVRRSTAASKPERPARPPRENLSAEDRAALERILSRPR